MIVAKTRCAECGDIIELDDKYGWTENDDCIKDIVCNCCNEDFDEYDEFED